MRGKLTFAAGAALGFVLGTRAGRERYEDIVRAARKILDSPSVHEAAGVVQSQASKLYEKGKDSLAQSGLSDRIGDRLRHPLAGHGDDGLHAMHDDAHQRMSSNSF